jgi:hypothetical protein
MMITDTTTALVYVAFVAIWTSAWLHWFFKGEIRHFLFAKVFPAAWRAGREPSDILTADREEFEMFLAGESDAPAFIRGVLGCPGCLSAYISAVGTVLAFFAFWPSVFLVPLVWAGGAWIGHRLHHYI